MKVLTALVALLLLCTVTASAQVAPGVFTTLKTTDVSVISLCVGCQVGSGTPTPVANSGARVATMTIDAFADPTITTNKLYNVAGALKWNGTTLATGSTIAGTTNTIGLFTGVASMGNSLLTQSGTTVTMAGTLAATNFVGAVPTTGLTGNYVASVASGTGVTSSVPTGNGAATTVSLNNTTVVPGAYPFVIVDQQGRVTSGSYQPTAAMQIITVGAPIATTAGRPLALVGSDSATSDIVLSGYSNVSGHAATVHLSDANTYNLAIGADGAGAFNVWPGRFPGTAGTSVHKVGTTGNVSVGSANVTDAVAVPTITSGFGVAPTIVGRDYAFKITFGTAAAGVGVVHFNQTYTNPPVCIPTIELNTSLAANAGATTTDVTIYTPTGPALPPGTVVAVLCRGY